MQRLEGEAENAQIVHASDTRALAARLVSEREASRATLVEGLRACEEDGEFSISGLRAMLKQASDQSAKANSAAQQTIRSLQGELEDERQLLKAEKASRKLEVEKNTSTIRNLKVEVARLETSLSDSQRMHRADVHFLCQELGGEEVGGEAYRAQVARAASAQAERHQAERRTLEAKLTEVKEQGYAVREGLMDQLRELKRNKDLSEGKLVRELRELEERRQYEFGMLKTRNEALTQQVLALKANTSTGRQKLYWSNLKSNNTSPAGSRVGSPTRSMTSMAPSMSSYVSSATPINPPLGGPGYYRFSSLPSQSDASSSVPRQQATDSSSPMMRAGLEVKGTGDGDDGDALGLLIDRSPPRRLIKGEATPLPSESPTANDA